MRAALESTTASGSGPLWCQVWHHKQCDTLRKQRGNVYTNSHADRLPDY